MMDARLLLEWAIGAVLALPLVGVVLRVRGLTQLSRRTGRDELERRIADLEDNQPQLDAEEAAELQHRIAELEERLDFAERMLARQRDAERLGTPRT